MKSWGDCGLKLCNPLFFYSFNSIRSFNLAISACYVRTTLQKKSTFQKKPKQTYVQQLRGLKPQFQNM